MRSPNVVLLPCCCCLQAPQAGEISAYKAEDGDAVEYNQVVVELSPYFGGHIIGDSKYA